MAVLADHICATRIHMQMLITTRHAKFCCFLQSVLPLMPGTDTLSMHLDQVKSIFALPSGLQNHEEHDTMIMLIVPLISCIPTSGVPHTSVGLAQANMKRQLWKVRAGLFVS